ncbi:MAG TPA: carboxypeptidase-like regulatory domain-containing protein [Vicinamibacterales bacterium]|jgi:hypothetical protein|nr:carboxypeptidase-like regulatory domain-containing protein [Vicinamibacterales bacterium]
MRSLLCLFLLASAVAPAAQAAPAVQTATVNVLVTDRHGKPLPSARVIVNGASGREGNTNGAGRVVFTNMETGAYTLRVERDAFITFEKDFTVSGQTGSLPVVAAISPVASLRPRPSRALASARRP